MGAVAEMFRQMPGSIRSDHPARSVCAWGKHAAYLTENHDLSNIFGDGSPIGKLYKLNGKVLPLGTGYGKKHIPALSRCACKISREAHLYRTQCRT